MNFRTFFVALLLHFCIIAISVILLILVADFVYSYVAGVLLFLVVASLYIVSGYMANRSQAPTFLSYTAVGILGFLLCFTCYILWPEKFNFPNGLLWFICNMYSLPLEMPFGPFFRDVNAAYYKRRELIILTLLPFAASALQYAGGRLKALKLKKDLITNQT